MICQHGRGHFGTFRVLRRFQPPKYAYLGIRSAPNGAEKPTGATTLLFFVGAGGKPGKLKPGEIFEARLQDNIGRVFTFVGGGLAAA